MLEAHENERLKIFHLNMFKSGGGGAVRLETQAGDASGLGGEVDDTDKEQ